MAAIERKYALTKNGVLIGALLVTVLFIGVGGGCLVAKNTEKPPVTYVVTFPDRAAGLEKNATWTNELQRSIERDRADVEKMVGGLVDFVETYYAKPSLAPRGAHAGPPPGVMFAAGTVAERRPPAEILRALRSSGIIKSPTVIEVDPGARGGRAECFTGTVTGESQTLCAWATDTVFGIVVPIDMVVQPGEAADLMRRLRLDVEKKK